jgi:hypothetical protein
MPMLAISEAIGRRSDPEASPRVTADGLALAVEQPTWVEGQLLVRVWLTLALTQDRFAEFLDPIAAVVVRVTVPELGLFAAWPLVDRTEIPLEPSVANYQGPTGWGSAAVTMEAYADFVLDLQLGEPNSGRLPEHVPESFSVFVQASLHELSSNTVELIPNEDRIVGAVVEFQSLDQGGDDAAGID